MKYLFMHRFKSLKTFDKSSIVSFLFLLFWTVYLLYFWSNAIYVDSMGNLMVTHVAIWGDWAAHFTMGSAMAYKELILQNSPFLVSAPFSYPFAANMISAVLIRNGIPFFQAFLVPSAIASILLVFVLFMFYRVLFKSQKIAILGTSAFLCNGGLGFMQFIADVLGNVAPLEILLNPPSEYTHLEDWGLEWISVIYSMVIPQRAFTLGFPLALIVLVLLYTAFFKLKENNHKRYIFIAMAAVITGALPLIHSHSFLALAVIIPFWGIASLIQAKHPFKAFRLWLIWLAVTALMAIPLVRLFLSENIGGNFFSWFPGWFAKEKEMNWFVFWFNNWGITPLLSLLGYFYYIKNQSSTSKKFVIGLLYAPFFVLFILLNLFLFQPFIWDNTKLLVWSSIGISGLSVYYLHFLWQSASKEWHHKNVKRIPAYTIIGILFLITIASGAIDAWRVIRFDLHTYEMYSREELLMSSWVKTNTDSHSVWLTGDKHNNWMYNLTGRQPLLTFRGWLWTHGYDYREVESDVSLMFQYPDKKEIFEKYGIDYALISQDEVNTWNADKASFDMLYPIELQTQYHTVYKIN